MFLALLLFACGLPDLADPANCSPRTAFYPDSDGDGEGEPGAIFIGCEAPAGWVETLDTDPPIDTVDSGDSGDSGTPTP